MTDDERLHQVKTWHFIAFVKRQANAPDCNIRLQLWVVGYILQPPVLAPENNDKKDTLEDYQKTDGKTTPLQEEKASETLPAQT